TQPSFAKDSLDGQVWNWIDYDNDGDLDAYVTNWGGSFGGLKNHLYQNNEGTFSKITEGDIVNDQGISLANVWADFDNDGDLDCFVGNGGNQPNRFYQNNGDGSFTTLAKGHLVESQKNTWGVTVGDYDNDGDQDLFVSNKTGYVQGPGDVNFLYRNDLNNGNHWLTIQCKGTKSNRQGMGARIYLTAIIGGRKITQYREVGSNNTFLGQNDVRAHFGLGDAKEIEKVDIFWPSGVVDVIEKVEMDQIVIFEEGIKR
ncbi:MAG: CRTAC1 family protein, partial [Bacteroidetes bacterium]|nr:CRTAC1 family protein [Bacteroidota bacterium]